MFEQISDQVFVIVVIISSVVVHELMHGVAADWLGDKTARYAGRLTLNPLASIDPIGTVLVPILTSFFGFFFGWAKPVPYNPYNFRRFLRYGEAIVAAAGPFSNLGIALVFGLIIRIGVPDSFFQLCAYVIQINASLFILNLIPIPPLDGSKVLTALLPGELGLLYRRFREFLELNFFVGMFLVILFVNILSGPFRTVVIALTRAIAGV